MKFFANESTTVGLWHFEETSGATQSDGSGNAYDLTDRANAPTRTTTPNFGGGLSLSTPACVNFDTFGICASITGNGFGNARGLLCHDQP